MMKTWGKVEGDWGECLQGIPGRRSTGAKALELSVLGNSDQAWAGWRRGSQRCGGGEDGVAGSLRMCQGGGSEGLSGDERLDVPIRAWHLESS